MILVTGATGHLGSVVIEHLLKNTDASQVAAFVRNEEKAADLKTKGVSIRVGNFDDIASLAQAMQGISKVLLISGLDANRLEQHKNVVDAAKKADVQLIAYTGVAMQGMDSSVNTLMESHFQTEDYIKESGLTYAFLRNTLYMEVLPMFLGEKVFETGIYLPAGQGKAPFALRNEMGEATANILLADHAESKIYDITNSSLYSFEEIAQTLTTLSGKEVKYTDADKDEFVELMNKLGVPAFAIQAMEGFTTDIKNGLLEIESTDLEKWLGRKPTTLKEGLKTIF